MKTLLFWTLCILLLAGAVHLGYVLIVPPIEMRAKIDELRQIAGSGELTVLSREDSVRLMGPDGRWLVHALCVYDLSEGPMMITATVPDSYWSMAIYSAGGETFYSLNDRQAGIEQVDLMIRRPSDQAPEEDEEAAMTPPTGDAFTVRAPDPVGVVVMRALADEGAEYGRAAEVMARSSCRPETGDSSGPAGLFRAAAVRKSVHRSVSPRYALARRVVPFDADAGKNDDLRVEPGLRLL